MLTPYVRRALVLVVLVLLAGCSGQGTTPPDLNRYRPLLQLAVQTATARLVAERPQAIPIALQVSGGLRMVMLDGNVTRVLPQLLDVLKQRMPWDKIPLELQPLVGALVTFIGNELQAITTRWQIPESELATLLGDVAGWVAQTAQQGRG